MNKTYDILPQELRAWIGRQKVFFVATAPLSANGHVNCSPKGGDTLRVIGGRQVAYIDLTGSGIETISHIQENGRIVLMFCAFEGTPKIVRLHGIAQVLYPDHCDYSVLMKEFTANPGARAIIRVDVARVSDSCGYAVPFMDFAGPRDNLDRWAEKKGPGELTAYRKRKNQLSIDGMKGYEKV